MEIVRTIWEFVNQPVFMVIIIIILYLIGSRGKAKSKEEKEDENEIKSKVDIWHCQEIQKETARFRTRIGETVEENRETLLSFRSALIALTSKLGEDPNEFGLMR